MNLFDLGSSTPNVPLLPTSIQLYTSTETELAEAAVLMS